MTKKIILYGIIITTLIIISSTIAISNLSDIKLFHYEKDDIIIDASYKIDNKNKEILVYNYSINIKNKKSMTDIIKKIEETKYELIIINS